MNGTNALLTSLHVLDVGIGDEVLVPPYTFVASISVVFMSNALPVFVDVDPETFQMNPDRIEERITEHTKPILPVHILGAVANMDKINAIAEKHNLKVIEEAETRNRNGEYLSSKIKNVPGITPQKFYRGQTMGAYHLYAFTYKKEHFNNVPRSKFLSALSREGIPASGEYRPLNEEGIIEDTLTSRNFQKAFSKKRLAKYRRENHCPDNDKLCTEAVWLPQWTLLGQKSDMDDIADAIQKVYDNRDKLA